MSIQRYIATLGAVQGNETGEFVLYADHVAAMGKAIKKADLTEAIIYHNRTEAYEQGILAERARIKAAVQALAPIDQRVDENGFVSLVYDKGEVLAIIDGEKDWSA